MRVTRKSFVRGAMSGIAAAAAGGWRPAAAPSASDGLPTLAEVVAWHELKDRHGGPTFTGSPAWRHFVEFLEAKFVEFGCVDLVRNSWTFDRWSTTAWPDRSGWSLAIGGRPVRVASFGANSGSTVPEGVTAPLAVYSPQTPLEAYAGRIVIFQTHVTPEALASLDWDYEYASPPVGFPRPDLLPAEPRTSQALRMFAQLPQCAEIIPRLVKSRAAGCLFVLDAGAEQAEGIYTFPVPEIHQLPSLYLDRRRGADALAAARRGAMATLRLIGTVERAEAHQTIAFLPGRNYGAPGDEIIQLVTHTDGPSISQDNGALGLLGLVKYYGRLPQAQRERTLMVFLDCRHFMPGAERAFARQDWFERRPEARKDIVAVVHMEHLGQVGYYENGDRLLATGQTEPFSIWATDNQQMVDWAIQAVKAASLPGAVVRNVDRPGIQGRSQGPWFGMGGFARKLGLPAFGVMGLMGGYWAMSSRLDRLDPDLFRGQVATFVELTGRLMNADLKSVRSPNARG